MWYTNPNPPAGETAVPVLVGTAEIHSIVVESSRASNVGEKNVDVEDALRRGTRYQVRNDAGGQAVDARLSIRGYNEIRGRISLDGYPQNEYWVTATDTGDLHQVVTVPDGQPATYYLQGYNKPSSSSDDLMVVGEGQALIEKCNGCSLFYGTSVTAEWQETDLEPLMSSWMIKSRKEIPTGGSSSVLPVPIPPVIAAAGASVTVQFQRYVDIDPAPTPSPSEYATTGHEIEGDFIRFVEKNGGDVTQTLEEYRANILLPETRMSKIAIKAQRYKDHVLQLDLEIGPNVALGWYHADANWGYEHAYMASGTVYGSDGSHRMRDVLAIIGIDFLTPPQEGSAEDDYEVATVVPQSAPAYGVEIVNTRASSSGNHTSVSISGYIYDPASEITYVDPPAPTLTFVGSDGRSWGTAQVQWDSGYASRERGFWRPTPCKSSDRAARAR